jgi:hypothetical protein
MIEIPSDEDAYEGGYEHKDSVKNFREIENL